MEADPLVAAFADSPALRETLSVLLEHDCDLRFLSCDTPPPALTLAADLAVLATTNADFFLRRLSTDWPTVPIVAIDLGTPERTAKDDARASGDPRYPHVRRVPLAPEAIRDAVLPHLRARPDQALRIEVARLGACLHAQLKPALDSLRSLGTGAVLHGQTRASAHAGIHRQARLIAQAVEQIEVFRRRPGNVQPSRRFVSRVCDELSRPAQGSPETRLRCECVLRSRIPGPPGPAALAPTLATLLHAHLLRRSTSPIISVFALQRGISIRYPGHVAPPAEPISWPLLLASLAVRACDWQIDVFREESFEIINVRPYTEVA
jgi:hypothetical protein